MAWLTINFQSESLHMPVMLDVLMPQGHGNYKTLYLLHGAGGDHASWVLKSQIADYVENKQIAVIMPSGNNKFYVNNRHGKNYEEFITKELVEKCETWFPLSHKKTDRYIAGMSMGGYGAVYSALSKPNQYATVFSYSGLLNILERYDKPQGIEFYSVFGEREELIANGKDLFLLAKQKLSNFCLENEDDQIESSTHFFIFCGAQDARLKMSQDFYQHLKELGYPVNLSTSEGAHNWEYWNYCLKQTIQYIEKDIKLQKRRV